MNQRANRSRVGALVASLLMCQTVAAQQGQVLDRVPPAPDMKARYTRAQMDPSSTMTTAWSEPRSFKQPETRCTV